jgi:hypothetical protein
MAVMNIRVLGLSILILLVLAGLISALFMGAIQRALTISPTMNNMMGSVPLRRPAVTVQPAPTATATMPGQMPINILAQDTFQRDNQDLWGIASDGRRWEADANDLNSREVFSIVNNSGRIAGKQGIFDAVLGPALISPTNPANVEVVLNGSVNLFANGKANIGSVVRWSDADNWYKALIDGTNLVILKRVNGKTTQLGNRVPFKALGNIVYTLRFRAVGATLFAKVWQRDEPEPADWMLTVTDIDLMTGKVGVRVVLQQNTTIKVTSFLATAASTMM